MTPEEFLQVIGVEDKGNLSKFLKETNGRFFIVGQRNCGRTWSMILRAFYQFMLSEKKSLALCRNDHHWNYYWRISVNKMFEEYPTLAEIFERTETGIYSRENGSEVIVPHMRYDEQVGAVNEDLLADDTQAKDFKIYSRGATVETHFSSFYDGLTIMKQLE